MAYPNPPKTWSAAAVLTAAQMNAEVRDALNTIIPTASTTLAWASYTPTLTQSGAVTKTVAYAKYFQIGKVVHLTFRLDVTGSGTANNAIVVGLPVTASTSGLVVVGSGLIWDNSASAIYRNNAYLASTTTLQFLGNNNTGLVAEGLTGAAMALGLANTDVISGTATYEAA